MQTENQDLNVFQKFKRLFNSTSQMSHIGESCTYPDCSNITSYKDIWRTRRENFSNCWDSFLNADSSKLLSCKDLEQICSFLKTHHDIERAAYLKACPEQASPHAFIQYFIAPRLLSELMKLHHGTSAHPKSDFSQMTFEQFKEFILDGLKRENPDFNDRYVDGIARAVFSVIRRDSTGGAT